MTADNRAERYLLKRNIYFPWECYGSKAFDALSKSQIKILLRFLQKRTWLKKGKGKRAQRVYKNGGLAFTYDEATALRISGTTFYDAVKKLIDIGFIELEHQGGAYGKDFSRYAISERWRDYGTAKFKVVKKKRTLPHGMDVRSNMRRAEKLLRKSVAMAEKD